MDVLIDHFIRPVGRFAHYGRYWSHNVGPLETKASRFGRESPSAYRPQDKIECANCAN